MKGKTLNELLITIMANPQVTDWNIEVYSNQCFNETSGTVEFTLNNGTQVTCYIGDGNICTRVDIE